MTLNRERFALPSLAATFVVQTTAAMAMFGVSVLAPVAAPDIGVEATLVGVFTGIAYGSGLAVGLLSGRLADRFGALRISQATMVFAFFGCLLLAVSTPLSALASAIALAYRRGRRRYGGQIVHLGVALVVVSIAVSSSYQIIKKNII